MSTRVICVTPDQDLFEVIGLLVKNKISGAPVVDRNGRYLGVFTERTSLALLLDAIDRGTPTNRIEAFIDSNAITVSPDTDLLTMAQILQNTHYRRLTVVQHGRVVGIISRRDILKAAHAMMRTPEVTESTFLYLSAVTTREEVHVG
jgi:CBS domain-containing protein